MDITRIGSAVSNIQLPTGSKTAASAASDETSFGGALSGAIETASGLQTKANEKVASLIASDGVDVHDAMISMQKADLSFQLMLQVRNKVVQAYQEVSRMNI